MTVTVTVTLMSKATPVLLRYLITVYPRTFGKLYFVHGSKRSVCPAHCTRARWGESEPHCGHAFLDRARPMALCSCYLRRVYLAVMCVSILVAWSSSVLVYVCMYIRMYVCMFVCTELLSTSFSASLSQMVENVHRICFVLTSYINLFL